jgi:hypothetical protein
MQPAAAVTAFACLAAALCAQRVKPSLEWMKRTSTIDYGAVLVGKHGLDELKVGQPWRLGMGDATRWSLQMPALLGADVLPPGEYRLRLVRLDEHRCAIVVEGSHFVLGGDDLRLPGELGRTKTPTKKLAIDWEKGTGKDKNQLPATLKVQFGENEWKGELALAGSKSCKVGAYQLTVFTLPAAAVATRSKPVPVAQLSKGTDAWNLLLGAGDSKLIPCLSVPADNFADLKGPDADATTAGKLEAADAPAADKEVEFLELRSPAALEKGAISLQLAAGKQTLAVTVPEPKARK